jgi:hypothetical protein
MSKPTRYASTTKGREAAAAEIERMDDDIRRRGAWVMGIYRLSNTRRWAIVTIEPDGDSEEHTGPTLNDAYLAAMHYPAPPPPF